MPGVQKSPFGLCHMDKSKAAATRNASCSVPAEILWRTGVLSVECLQLSLPPCSWLC